MSTYPFIPCSPLPSCSISIITNQDSSTESHVESETRPSKHKNRRRHQNRTSKAKHIQLEQSIGSESSQISEFTHIRLVRQPELTQSSESSPRPTFRNPSLSFETEASLEEELSYPNNPSASSDSLASHPHGVTFAARARAAELQAARARRELKAQTPNLNTRQEIMTFKARAKKKWSVLDLSTLPEPDQGSPSSPYDSIEGSESLDMEHEEESNTCKESENLNDENKTPRV